MRITIENDALSVVISSHGGELQSIITKGNGTEQLWQGDPEVWNERAPNLFPICGRLPDQRYIWQGNEYQMGLHGFASSSEMEVISHDRNRASFRLTENEDTLSHYPFRFRYEITYTLDDRRVLVEYLIENRSDGILPFSFGAHPGFRLPVDDSEAFEDYLLRFSSPSSPSQLCFTDQGLLKGIRPIVLENGTDIPLRHEDFDLCDSLFLTGMPHTVSLISRKTGRFVRVTYPDFPYLGFWQTPNRKAHYLCIEPWHGTPSRCCVTEDFSVKSDMIKLASGEIYTAYYSMEFGFQDTSSIDF